MSPEKSLPLTNNSIGENDYGYLKDSVEGVIHIDKVEGGLVHDVYKLHRTKGNLFLKHRGDCFSQIKEISCNPNDLQYEFKALSIFHDLAPQNFPEVIDYNKEQHYVLMTDVQNNGVCLQELFRTNQTDKSTVRLLSRTLREIHEKSKLSNEAIHEDDDNNAYTSNLYYRFGYQNNDSLSAIVTKLTNDEPRQLIHGDLSPKNIIIGADGVGVYDLENAHKGNAIFDNAFLLGHIILHSHQNTTNAIDLAQEFIDGYGANVFSDMKLFKGIMIGTIMYRLQSVIPYPINLVTAQKKMIYANCEALLPKILTQYISWEDIISSLYRHTSLSHSTDINNLKKQEQIVYKKRHNGHELSINITNECTNACTFCIRNKHNGWDQPELDNLFLNYEPSINEIVSEVDQMIGKEVSENNKIDLIKYCGFGEPMLRPEILIGATKILKHRYPNIQFQIDTNGWTYFIHEDSTIIQRLASAGIDRISVSVNADNEELYQKINRPNNFFAQFNAYRQAIQFMEIARSQGIKVRMTILNLPGVDIEACKELADRLSVDLLIRDYVK